MAVAPTTADKVATVESPKPDWHATPVEKVLNTLSTRDDGLTAGEVAQRLEEHGPNRLPQAEIEPAWKRFLRQFHDTLIYILIVAAFITALLDEWIDTWVILAVVFINALIGFVQEGKAEAALASIRKMLSLSAVVRRDGERMEIEADELVPGDIVFIESGDRVPADLRLLQVRNLQVQEAPLTGESTPVSKQVDPVEGTAGIGDRLSMMYSGTTVTRGQGWGVVVATGTHTEIGRIGEMISRVDTIATPLLRAIARFGKILSVIILGAAALAFGFAYLVRGFPAEDAFLLVVGLAVAAIPEGLPAIMTITLALGVQRMAKQRAILRRLPAVETLGSVTVICSDKTGTLTRNEMTVSLIRVAGQDYSVTGTGFAPEGHLQRDEEQIELEEDSPLDELVKAGVLASDARLREREGQWMIEGDPTEGALVVLGAKLDRTGRLLEEKHRRLDVVPFESENRYMATLNESPGGRRIYVKGAPERILEMCDSQRTADGGTGPVDAASWEETVVRMADGGHRVLAIASREADAGQEKLTPAEAEAGLTLIGMVGIIDPPREEAIQAVKDCKAAGIRVKMITGDHALTARAIGAQLGIGDGTDAVTGADLEQISDEDLVAFAHEHDVFARTSPEHKLRLVEALQKRGDVVAMTGDGVNDAPALKRADVGVAMGIKGAEASKDAAEMVLTDDNFATIATAVREGRTIYDNLKKTILFILPTNGAEALMVLSALLLPAAVFGFAADGEVQLPITAVQILWVNMVTAVTLALALAFEPTEPGTMKRPPRDPDEPILSGYLLWRIAFVSVLIATAGLLLYFREMNMHQNELLARTVAVNVLVVGQFAYLFNSRYIRSSVLSVQGIFGNRYVLLAGAALFVIQMAFTYVPAFNLWFGTEGLPLDRWLWINVTGLLVFLLVEAEKAVMRGVGRRSTASEINRA